MYYLLFLHNYSLASTPKVTNHKNKSNILLHCPSLAYRDSINLLMQYDYNIPLNMPGKTPAAVDPTYNQL